MRTYIADKETLDNTFANTQAILAAVDPGSAPAGIKRYGIKINKNDSNPETRCTYLYDAVGKNPAKMNFVTGTFDYGDWADVFFVKNNYPAMVTYAGVEDYKLNKNDQTKKEDGVTLSNVSDALYGGNAMSVFDCKIWLSQYEVGNYEYMVVSNVKYDESYNDYAYVREDGSTADKLYYPMFKGSDDGTRLRSLADKAVAHSTTAAQEVAKAKANGENWNIGSWSKRNLLNCLLKIISKTDNSQAAFGQGDTNTYVNDASQNYGHVATGTLKDKGQFYGYNDKTHEVKVFYIEGCWGNRWDRINGLICKNGDVLAKMTPPYNFTGSDYESTGIIFTSNGNGWEKYTKSGKFGRICNSTGGSSSTYTCDYFWYGVAKTTVAMVGGYCNSNDYCGADCFEFDSYASAAGMYAGASIFLN